MHMKQQVYEHLMLPLGESMTETHKLIESSVAEKDFMEGVTAFVQRRPPNFPRLQIDD